MTYEIAPPLISGDAMLPETKSLIEEFQAQAPRPAHLVLHAVKLRHPVWSVCRPSIHLGEEDLEEAIPLRNFPDLKDYPVFSKMLHHVLADEKIEYAVRKLQPKKDMNLDLGVLHLLVMPGLLRLSYPMPRRFAATTHKASKGSKDFDAGNFGAFLAGEYNSAHEQLEATNTLMGMKSIWGPMHDDFNRHMTEVKGPYRLIDPKPGTEPEVIER